MSEEQIQQAAHRKAIRAYNRIYRQEYIRLSTESRFESYNEKEQTILQKFRKPSQERRSFWNWLFYA